MRNPQGYATIVDPDVGGVRECDTTTCGHCNAITHVKPKMRPEDMGGLCKACMKLICAKCVDHGTCDPFLKKLERAEARYHALRSYGLIG
jgi:hypothetical protein